MDQRPLVGEVPDAGAPVLKVDVSQLCPGADVQLDRAAMQAGGRGVQAGRLGQHGRFGALFEHDQRVSQVDPVGRERRKHVQRTVDHHALGHVEHHAARPTGGVQRGKLIGMVIDGRKQIRPQQVSMRADQLVQTAEQNALPGQRGVEVCAGRAAIQRRRVARKIHARAEKRLDVRSPSSLGTEVPSPRCPFPLPPSPFNPVPVLVPRRCREPKLLQPEPADIGPHPFFQFPVGQRQLLKRRPCLPAQRDQPRRLPAIGQKRFERFGGKPATCDGCGHDRLLPSATTGRGLATVSNLQYSEISRFEI